ncbi:MAG: lysostaphin resistance A-like protein [Candidatus Acidiferrales bacterium]
MSIDPAAPDSILPAPEPAPAAGGGGGFRMVFMGPNGIRAGWRLAMFLLIGVSLQYVIVQRGLRLIPGTTELFKQAQVGGLLSPYFELVFESAVLIVVLLAAGVMSRMEKRPFGAYGIPLENAFGKLFWQGVLWGLAFETVEMLAIFAFGGFSFGTLALAGTELVKYAVLWAIGFVLVGLFEEFFFRGYAQFTLGSGIGFWPAAFLLSAAFGAVHLSNQGVGWVGALSVFVFGIFGCFVLRRTGNLWFIVGFHAATDYAETFIYSTPDSGLLAQGHLLNSTFHGPRWLTGGTIGPEGSVMDFVVFAIVFVAFNWAYPANKGATAH